MSLLKEDGTIPPKPATRNIIIAWPTKRLPEGIGMSVKDGWYWGIGFGMAMVIAIPVILTFLSCLIGLAIVLLGSWLGSVL